MINNTINSNPFIKLNNLKSNNKNYNTQSINNNPVNTNNTSISGSTGNKSLDLLGSSQLDMINKFLIQKRNSVSVSQSPDMTELRVKKTLNIQEPQKTDNFVWKNDLKKMFQQNKAVIYAMIPRTFNAEDKNGDGLIDVDKGERQGTFINAIERLDELKKMGINTLHVLPIQPPAKKGALGIAGCVYAPDSYTKMDPKLDDPNDPRDVYQEAKAFTDACHKKGIRVMVDLPSCSSIEFAEKNPHLIATNKDGTPKVPQGWDDIRAFKPWEDEEKKILNKPLMDMHKGYVDMVQKAGFDGIRADVARYKPPEFWSELIDYSHKKDPNFAFLAETYTYEDSSPMANIPADRPEDCLNAGFDLIYGQFHIFPHWSKSKQVHGYIKEITDMSNKLPPNKGLIGSFATHDDNSSFSNGGVPYCNMTVGMQATLPMVNPYFVSGFESGDRYIYPYRNQYVEKTDTDNHVAFAHPEWIDIFNYSRKPGGKNPEIGDFMGKMFEVRKKHEDVLTKGSYIPLKTKGNKDDRIIAYARHLNGKTLVAIANKNVNAHEKGTVEIPTLKKTQTLKDLTPAYGLPTKMKVQAGKINVDVGPARFHLFEVDTPDIEKASKEVYKQNLAPIKEAPTVRTPDKNTNQLIKDPILSALLG